MIKNYNYEVNLSKEVNMLFFSIDLDAFDFFRLFETYGLAARLRWRGTDAVIEPVLVWLYDLIILPMEVVF